MRRIAGPDLPRTDELKLHAMHDVQKFIVEAFEEWVINTDGEVDIRVKWRGHEEEEERTWEPLEQLVEDVPALIRKYVHEQAHPQLTAAHRQAIRAAKKN